MVANGCTGTQIPLVKLPRMSLRRRLPLVMTALVAAVLMLGLWLSRGELVANAERVAAERMMRASQGIAASAEQAVRQRSREINGVMSSPSFVRALRSRDSAALRRALESLRHGDSVLVYEVWDAEGRTLARAGLPLDPRERTAAFGTRLARFPLTWTKRGDVIVTPLYGWDDRVHFWRIGAVADRDSVIGYVVTQARAVSPASALVSLRTLVGEQVVLYLRNYDDSFWSVSPGRPHRPPIARDSSAHATYIRFDGTERAFATEAEVRGTPWFVSLQVPASVVLGPTRPALWRFAFGGALLILAAAVIAWLLGRRIARPLMSLTEASEAVARGEYDRRVMVDSDDEEIGRLAAAFNQMAREVGSTRESLERRTREAESARSDAERANRAKGDFLAVMSHELRTPLNAINGYAELLKLGVYGPVNDRQEEALGRIARSQEHLLSLINNVLNFARIDAGQMQFDLCAVSVADVVAAIEPLVAPQLLARSLRFTVLPGTREAPVRADPDKLRQVLLNLLSNAIKFTPAGGRIDLAYERQEDTVVITVADTGAGIPADRLAVIFDPFVQGDRALNRPHDGVGLGLAISRDLARGMGGELTVTSEVGHGSVFSLRLPVAAPGAPPVPAMPVAAIRHPTPV